MSADENVLKAIAQSLRDVAGSAIENSLAFVLPLFALSGLVAGIRWVADKLDGYPVVALAFIAVCALFWLGLVAIVTPSSMRGSDGKIRPGFVAGFAAAAAMVWIYIFAVLSYLLLRLGAVEFVITAHPDAPLSDLLDAYSWYFLDLIPVLHINDALGWATDVDLNGGWRGVLLLLFRVVIVFQVFALAKRLFDASKERPDASSGTIGSGRPA
jgi:hypothetical protein